ncbi:MAG: hypothetical protein QXR19_04695 [Candidatus Jordarchaeaceae archaeon]
MVCYDKEDLEGEPVYLATSRLHWDASRVILLYGLRFRIDNSYRDTLAEP